MSCSLGLGHFFFITHGFYIGEPLLGLTYQSGLDKPQSPPGNSNLEKCSRPNSFCHVQEKIKNFSLQQVRVR